MNLVAAEFQRSSQRETYFNVGTQASSMFGTPIQDRMLFCGLCALIAIAAAVGLLSMWS